MARVVGFGLVELTRQSSKFEAQVRGLSAGLAHLLDGPKHTAARTGPASPVQRRLTADQTAELAAEYRAGTNMKQLALRWEVHRTTVAGHLRRAGVELRRQGLSPEQISETVRLYSEGWSCRLLSERFSCDDETVRQRLLSQGVELRKPWQRG